MPKRSRRCFPDFTEQRAGFADVSASPKVYPHFKSRKESKVSCKEQTSGSARKKSFGRIQSVKEQKAKPLKKQKLYLNSAIKFVVIGKLF